MWISTLAVISGFSFFSNWALSSRALDSAWHASTMLSGFWMEKKYFRFFNIVTPSTIFPPSSFSSVLAIFDLISQNMDYSYLDICILRYVDMWILVYSDIWIFRYVTLTTIFPPSSFSSVLASHLSNRFNSAPASACVSKKIFDIEILILRCWFIWYWDVWYSDIWYWDIWY